jgi:hypothetical protein
MISKTMDLSRKLLQPSHDGPATDVPNHHSQAQGDRHRHLQHQINDRVDQWLLKPWICLEKC